jgi:hypothetical protein
MYLEDETFRLTDVEMLPNGVWQDEIYDTWTSQLSGLENLVRNLDLEGEIIPKWVKKSNLPFQY